MPKTSVHSLTAEKENRNQYGKFASSISPVGEPIPPPSPVTPSPPYSQNSSKSSNDDIINFKVRNPVTMILDKLKGFFKKQAIHASINIPPLTAIAIILILMGGSFGLGYGTGFNTAVSRFFPNSSPILHRAFSIQGILQKGTNGQYFLTAGDNALWNLKSKSDNSDLSNLINTKVEVKGNLTIQPNLIENAEILPLEPSASPTGKPNLVSGTDSIGSNQDANFPKLYSNIRWETTQAKVLLFTSGKRRINVDGVYLESAELKDLPQDFINYYTDQLQTSSFNQTLNSSSPDGITKSYEKEGLFLTFGVKFIYSGSGDKKQLTGYKAYIEHN